MCFRQRFYHADVGGMLQWRHGNVKLLLAHHTTPGAPSNWRRSGGGVSANVVLHTGYSMLKGFKMIILYSKLGKANASVGESTALFQILYIQC